MSQESILRNFIVFEGLDGSGTTTQTSLLRERLENGGRPCHATFEPTRAPIGTMIRSILGGGTAVTPYTMALLFAADRQEHLYAENGLAALAASGITVISDRYLFSSLAYQSGECGFSSVLSLNANFPLPEILFYLDLDPEICMERIAGRGRQEIYENLAKQKEVYGFYRQALEHFSDTAMRIVRLDGNLPIRELAENIWNYLA